MRSSDWSSDVCSSDLTVSIEDFQTAMADTAATGLPPEAEGNYEGWLFAGTYTFEPGTTPTQMLAAMIAQTITVLDQNGVPADQREPVLLKAALIERESTAERRVGNRWGMTCRI